MNEAVAVTPLAYIERVLKEQQEALRIAETEREKAAATLRASLEREIQSGDARLTEHIDHQVEQVRQGLVSLQALLHERDGRMDDRFIALKEATLVARQEAREAFTAHNGLIRKMEAQVETYPTRKEITEGSGRRLDSLEKFQYRLFGAFGLAMIIMPIIVGVLVYFLTRTAIPIDGLQQ